MTLGKQISTALAVTVVSSAVVYLICLIVPKTYESQEALLFPASQNQGSSIIPGILTGNNQTSDISAYAAPNSMAWPIVASQTSAAMGLLESRRCGDQVIEKLGLEKKWHTTRSRALDRLQKQTKVKVDENGLLVVSAQADNPQLAKGIVDAMHAFLNSDSVRLTLSIAERNLDALNQKSVAAEKAVEKARKQLVSVATRHPYVSQDPIQQLLADGLKRLGDIRTELAADNAKITHYENLVASALKDDNDVNQIEVIKGNSLSTALDGLAQDLQKRREEFEDAQRTFTQRDPTYRLAFDRVQASKKTLQANVDKTSRSLKNGTYAPLIQLRAEYESIKQSEKTYQQVLDEYRKIALKTPEDMSQVRLAQSAFDTALKNAEMLRYQVEQASIAVDRDPARFEVVDDPIADPEPVAPRKGLITGAWACCVLAVASWVIIRQRIRFVD